MSLSADTYQALGLASCTIFNAIKKPGGNRPNFSIRMVPVQNGKILRKGCGELNPDTEGISTISISDVLLVYDLNAWMNLLAPFESLRLFLEGYEPKIDVRELAQILMPLEKHPSGKEMDQDESGFAIPVSFIHSQFQRCLHEALGLSKHTIQTFHNLAQGAEDGLGLFFYNLNRYVNVKDSLNCKARRNKPKNTLGEPGFSAPVETERTVDPEMVSAYFKQNGLFSRYLESYEHRKGQEDMADAVVKALNRQEFLITEAGTGIGKSLAYLLPALIWLSVNPGQRVLVSTHTRTLQHQLFSKELPFLEKLIPDAFYAVLLKGRSNYLCLKRWEGLSCNPKSNLSPEERRQMLPIVVWADETGDGDIDMHPSFSADVQYPLWRKINADDPDCDRSRCPHEPVCFVQRIRKAARQADLVVINHALLFSDMAASGSILGPYSALIVDEAHQIEKAASSHLGVRLQPGVFKDLIKACSPVKSRQKNLFTRFHAVAAQLTDDAVQKLEQLINIVDHRADRIAQSSIQFFEALKRYSLSQQEGTDTRIRFVESPFNASLSKEFKILNESLDSLEWAISQCARWIQEESFESSDDLFSECVRLMDQVENVQKILFHFALADYEKTIVWSEIHPDREDRAVILYSVPLEIGQILSEQLYSRLSRCVFTSATLSVSGEFNYFIHQLGLDRIESERLVTRLFGSPFHYDDQVLFCISEFLPSPQLPEYVDAASDLIIKILEMHSRGTLILFTSNVMLQSIYGRVKESLDQMDNLLMAQGIDGNRDQLLRQFRSDQKSVLFGTNSFWEGIDVPGPALETLIISRIPFDVPSDPVVQARTENIHRQTGNGFMCHTLPEAIIRLRQGFGRLIRSSQDRGLMLLMDNRILKKQYGAFILKSLPVQPLIAASENDLLDAINTWFHTVE